jgi:WD40 repeat protein
MSSDGEYLVCGSKYGSIGILNTIHKEYITVLRSHTGVINDMAFHKPSSRIVSVSKDNTIRMFGATF